jgi:hypothetical protein
VKLEEARTPEDLNRLVEESVTRSVRRAWKRGYESGVVTGRAIAFGEPLPQSILEYLQVCLVDTLEDALEDAES